MATTDSTPPQKPKAKDYHRLWKRVTGAADGTGAIRALAEIVADSDGRSFISGLGDEDVVFCIEALDYGMTEYKLKPAERNNFFLTLRRLTENSGRLPDRMVMADSVDASGKIVASGGFGDVRAGTYMGRRVAVKTARVTERSDLRKIKKQFYKEVLLWETLSHPNILGLVGVWVDMKKGEFVTVSEWMVHGNIMEFIARYPANRLELLHQAAQGLEYLHSLNITHGDLKGANILMSNDTPPRACLADFGFTTTVLDIDQHISCSAHLEGGTTMFLAPELLAPQMFGNETSIHTQGTDIYAFAFVIFQILAGELPYQRAQVFALVFSVVLNEKRPEKPQDSSAIGFSESLWDFTQRCWSGKAELRPKVGELVTHLEKAAADWVHGPMPPHIRSKDAAPDSGEEQLDSIQHGGALQSSLVNASESSTDSQSTSGTFSSSGSVSSPCTESSQEGSQNDISGAAKEPQPESSVSESPSETPPSPAKQERKSAKFLELLRMRH